MAVKGYSIIDPQTVTNPCRLSAPYNEKGIVHGIHIPFDISLISLSLMYPFLQAISSGQAIMSLPVLDGRDELSVQKAVVGPRIQPGVTCKKYGLKASSTSGGWVGDPPVPLGGQAPGPFHRCRRDKRRSWTGVRLHSRETDLGRRVPPRRSAGVGDNSQYGGPRSVLTASREGPSAPGRKELSLV